MICQKLRELWENLCLARKRATGKFQKMIQEVHSTGNTILCLGTLELSAPLYTSKGKISARQSLWCSVGMNNAHSYSSSSLTTSPAARSRGRSALPRMLVWAVASTQQSCRWLCRAGMAPQAAPAQGNMEFPEITPAGEHWPAGMGALIIIQWKLKSIWTPAAWSIPCSTPSGISSIFSSPSFLTVQDGLFF